MEPVKRKKSMNASLKKKCARILKVADVHVKTKLGWHNGLKPFQKAMALNAYCKKNDMFVNVGTGQGKNLLTKIHSACGEDRTALLCVEPTCLISQNFAKEIKRQVGDHAIAYIDSVHPDQLKRHCRKHMRPVIITTLSKIVSTHWVLTNMLLHNSKQWPRLVCIFLDEYDFLEDWKAFMTDIKKLAPLIKKRKNVPVILASATGTIWIRNNLSTSLALRDPEIYTEDPIRKNLKYSIRLVPGGDEEMFGHICNIIEQKHPWLLATRKRITVQNHTMLTRPPTDQNQRKTDPPRKRRGEAMVNVIREEHLKQIVIFFESKKGVAVMTMRLRAKYPQLKIQNVYSVNSCEHKFRTAEGYARGEFHVLVGTTSAEKGVDSPFVDTVIIVGSPKNVPSYFQRAGRARATGKVGVVILLVSDMPTAPKPVDGESAGHHDHCLRSYSHMCCIISSTKCRLNAMTNWAKLEMGVGNAEEVECIGCDVCDGDIFGSLVDVSFVAFGLLEVAAASCDFLPIDLMVKVALGHKLPTMTYQSHPKMCEVHGIVKASLVKNRGHTPLQAAAAKVLVYTLIADHDALTVPSAAGVRITKRGTRLLDRLRRQVADELESDYEPSDYEPSLEETAPSFLEETALSERQSACEDVAAGDSFVTSIKNLSLSVECPAGGANDSVDSITTGINNMSVDFPAGACSPVTLRSPSSEPSMVRMVDWSLDAVYIHQHWVEGVQKGRRREKVRMDDALLPHPPPIVAEVVGRAMLAECRRLGAYCIGSLFKPGKTADYLKFLTQKQGRTPRSAFDSLNKHVSDTHKSQLDWKKVSEAVEAGWRAHEADAESKANAEARNVLRDERKALAALEAAKLIAVHGRWKRLILKMSKLAKKREEKKKKQTIKKVMRKYNKDIKKKEKQMRPLWERANEQHDNRSEHGPDVCLKCRKSRCKWAKIIRRYKKLYFPDDAMFKWKVCVICNRGACPFCFESESDFQRHHDSCDGMG
mmetsp:Transcript_25189/g.44782  ORF Transcript_25189/g.44782 Transcript_25189/m.44782 type:complete len:987 (-) Transcript_25189:212-3172(-)